ETAAGVVVEPSAHIRRTQPERRDLVHRLGGALWLPPQQRKSQIRTRLGAAGVLALPLLWVGQWFTALLRVIALFVCKAPDAALSQLAASTSALLNIRALAHLRRVSRTGRRVAAARAEGPDEAKRRVARGRQRHREDRLSAASLRAQRRRDVTAETVSSPNH